MRKPKNVNIYFEVGIQSSDIYVMLCDRQGNSTLEKATLGVLHVYDDLYITGSVSFLYDKTKGM